MNKALNDYLLKIGYTYDEFKACADKICEKGIGASCFEDYVLLTHVLNYLFGEYQCVGGDTLKTAHPIRAGFS